MRIKRSVNALKKRRKIMRLAKGYFGSKSRSYRIAREAVMKSQMYAFVGRRLKKRDFRKLWIARIMPQRASTDCLTASSCTGSKFRVSTSTERFLQTSR